MRSIKEIPSRSRDRERPLSLTQIGDQATGSSAGWTFKVDGEFANQGIGRTPLNPTYHRDLAVWGIRVLGQRELVLALVSVR